MPRVASNGIELYYDEVGAGEPLVLVMGLGAQMIGWDARFVELLAARGFRVIRFDNRDVGESAWLDHLDTPRPRSAALRALVGLQVRAPYTLREMAADVVGLLDALAIDRAHVVGASMGGMIVQTLAIEHGARVRSVASIMSHTGDRRSSIGKPRAIRQLLRPRPHTRDEAIDHHVEALRVIGSRRYPAPEARLRARASRAFDRGFHPHGFARQFAAVLASGSRTRALGGVRVPAVVIHGTDDPLIPLAGGRATARAIPGAWFRVLEGMAHDLPEPLWPQIIDAIARNAARARV